jgi:aryl-alcohol dehydrogenase-like predicted oxidoreductase
VARAIDESLIRLGVERIDYFLLHDVSSVQALSADLIEVLSQAQSAGKVARVGLSGSIPVIEEVVTRFPLLRGSIQFENSLANPQSASRTVEVESVFTFRALHENYRRWADGLRNDPVRRKRLEESLKLDLSTDASTSGLWLRYAVFLEPTGTILFSSRNPANIRINTEAFRAGPLSSEQSDVLRADYDLDLTR